MLIAPNSLLTTTNTQLHQYHHIHYSTNNSTPNSNSQQSLSANNSDGNANSGSSSSSLSECSLSSSPARASSCSPPLSASSDSTSNLNTENKSLHKTENIKLQISSNTSNSYNSNDTGYAKSLNKKANLFNHQQSVNNNRYHPYHQNMNKNDMKQNYENQYYYANSLPSSSSTASSVSSISSSSSMQANPQYPIDLIMSQQPQYQFDYENNPQLMHNHQYSNYYQGIDMQQQMQYQMQYTNAQMSGDLSTAYAADHSSKQNYYYDVNSANIGYTNTASNGENKPLSSLLMANPNQFYVPSNYLDQTNQQLSSNNNNNNNSNEFYASYNKQLFQQQYSNDYVNNDNLATANQGYSNDYIKQHESSSSSSSSLSSSNASSPLSSLNTDLNQNVGVNLNKTGLKRSVDNTNKLNNGSGDRQSRLTAFNMSRANKKQKTNLKAKTDANPAQNVITKSKIKQERKNNNSSKNSKLMNDANDKIKQEIKQEPSSAMNVNVPGEPKKRVSANKKERRRTQSINCAFDDLRNKIPQIPKDTKLSKIKTLKLATEYIEHLMILLENGTPNGPIEISFKPDLGKLRRECRSREIKVNYFFYFGYFYKN